MYRFRLLIALLSVFLLSCEREKPIELVPITTTPYNIKIPLGFPNRLNIPEDNPLTVEGVLLWQTFVL